MWEETYLFIFIYFELRIDYAVTTLSKSRNRPYEERGASVVRVGRVMPPGPTQLSGGNQSSRLLTKECRAAAAALGSGLNGSLCN